MSTEDDLFHALHAAGDFTALPDTVVHDGTKLRFLGRVDPRSTRRWLDVVRVINEWADGSSRKADTSKLYFLRREELIFAWRIIIEASDLSSALMELVGALDTVQAGSVDSDVVPVEEYPLPGASADRNAMGGGRRGAALMGAAVVGPMAMSM